MRELLTQFKGIGGDAIEVHTSSHTPAQYTEFARYARQFGLLASCGSDYHGPGDTAERVNYAKLAQDAQLIAQIIEEIARLQSPPKFLDMPVYPANEIASLERELEDAV